MRWLGLVVVGGTSGWAGVGWGRWGWVVAIMPVPVLLPLAAWASATTVTPACVPAAADGSCSAAVCCAVCPDPADCTPTMQAALDSPTAHTVVFSARTWVTQPLHLVRNDTTLVFAPGALVLAKAGAFQEAYDCLFACYLARNLTIRGYGATWRMRRSDYNDSAKYAPSVSPPRSCSYERAC